MAGKIKGITIEIDGDTTKLDKALTGLDKQTTSVNKELRQVNSLLKFNPGNSELVAQKQQLLAKQVETTSQKLKTLKEAQSQVDAQFKAGDIGEDQYRAFQREVVATQGKLDSFSGQLKNTDTYLKDNNDAAGMAAVGYSKAAVKASQAGTDVKTMGQKADEANDQLSQIAQNTFTDKLQNVGDAFGDIGQKIQQGAQAAIDAWSDMDDSVDNLTSKTGATGNAAAQLGSSFEKVEGTLAGSQMQSEDLSNTMAALKSTFGLTGTQLESTTETVAKFSAVTGQSGADAVEAMRSTLGKFNISAKEMPAVLDAFTAASQSSGVSVDDLESAVAQAQPVFSQMHIGLAQGVSIIANWSKAGLDSETSIKALTKASATYAGQGNSMTKGLTETFNAIKNAKNGTDAMNAATDAFGTRSGPKMLAAIQGNKISLDDLKGAASSTGGTVSSTFNQTIDPIDKAKQAQTQFKQSLAEVGGEILATLAPMMKLLADFGKKVAEQFTKLPGPLKIFIAALGTMAVVIGVLAPVVASLAIAFFSLDIALGPFIAIIAGIAAAITGIILIIKNWGTIVAWLKGVWGTVSTFFAGLWNSIKQIFTSAIQAISAFLSPAFNAMKSVITSVFNAIKAVVSAVWGVIKTIIIGAITIIAVTLGTIIHGWVTLFRTAFNAIKAIVTVVWNWMKPFILPIVKAISSGIKTAWNGIKSVTSSVFNGIKSVISSVWNGIKSVISGAVKGIKSVITGAWNGIKSITSSVFNGIKSVASSVWNGIKSAISTPINAAKNIVKGAIDAIKGFFSFKISWPHIPMPHFGISPAGWKVGDLLKGKIPHLSISWNAAGGIFTKPTLFSQGGGNFQGVGEAGPEGVLPLNDRTFDAMGAAIAAHMPSGSGPTYLVVDGKVLGQVLQGPMDNANGTVIDLSKRGLAT